MPTEPSPEDHALAQRFEAIESSFEALNARIARLAIALGVSLETDQAITKLMSEHPLEAVASERRLGADRRGASRTSQGPDRRLAHKREELRGLLVLRYGVETRYVAQHGVVATRQILVEAEAHLVRDGFKPGADGPHAGHLLDKP
jgi:hypothetical protein